ncbi:MAG TPA: 3-hydroxyacyl-CoA dehydrogenase [Burkholderiaceae bacterium]|jgi:3-hydroxybutyryl-CoA dehydrogenase|nr:3-hydroxyacyl-CoA dehydrogenase [Burkholderiaceae bacterium]HRA77174.1 3-hydroxyacyl-CoA dehydrogenase [Burkholderiaceae bacterium]
MSTPPFQRIGVVGSGAMGRGIAQLFVQSGIPVRLHDNNASALAAAFAGVEDVFAKLVEKGRMSADAAAAARARLVPADALAELADCDLVVEAIVERLDVKRELFVQLESIVSDAAVLASNTSSLSVTAIAAACRRPGRVAGYHFFNPVPLMKVVEVVEGIRTEASVVERLSALTRLTGHLPVVARDTPGFIVNHAGRGFGTEALKALGEGVADVPAIDRILREQVAFDGQGFRLGPFELMDLTGLDVSQPVMESIYRQFYDEPRFRPSVIAAQRLAAGLTGRKTGEGFYVHSDGRQQTPPDWPVPTVAVRPPVWIAPGPRTAALRDAVAALQGVVQDTARPTEHALVLVAPLGLDATAAAEGLPAARTVAVDTLFPVAPGQCRRRVLMSTPATRADYRDAAHALFATDGASVSMLRDSPGFVAQRVLAMIVSIGTEIAQQRIASPADIDTAVRIGLGYPLGPLAMGDALGPATVLEILENMHRLTGDPRYRPGAWLRRRAKLGLSLLHED